MSVCAHHTTNRSLLTSSLRYTVCQKEAERRASGAADSRSDAGAKAIGGRLQANVRLGRLVGLWVGCPLSGSPACPCASLLDHLIGLKQDNRGNGEPEGLGGLEVDD